MVWYDESCSEQANISFKGHLQQATAELAQSIGTTFTKTYSLWCPYNTDVQQGDKLTSGSDIYMVRAIITRLVGSNKHLELIVEKEESYL